MRFGVADDDDGNDYVAAASDDDDDATVVITSLSPVIKAEFTDVLTCSICFGVPITPYITPCDHIFCFYCIQNALFRSNNRPRCCPNCRDPCDFLDLRDISKNKFMYRMWSTVAVKCEYHEEGCSWTGSIHDYHRHLQQSCDVHRPILLKQARKENQALRQEIKALVSKLSLEAVTINTLRNENEYLKKKLLSYENEIKVLKVEQLTLSKDFLKSMSTKIDLQCQLTEAETKNNVLEIKTKCLERDLSKLLLEKKNNNNKTTILLQEKRDKECLQLKNDNRELRKRIDHNLKSIMEAKKECLELKNDKHDLRKRIVKLVRERSDLKEETSYWVKRMLECQCELEKVNEARSKLEKEHTNLKKKMMIDNSSNNKDVLAAFSGGDDTDVGKCPVVVYGSNGKPYSWPKATSYCSTHGVVRGNHNSGNCRNPGKNHRRDATFENRNTDTDSQKNIEKHGWFVAPDNTLVRNKEDFFHRDKN